MPSRWDVQILARAALVATVALGLALLITAVTDEGGVSWSERAGRTLPLAPACAAVGTWVVLAPVSTRGEALALAALGRSRMQVATAAVAGAALVALGAAVLIGATPSMDITVFFPRAARASTWAWQDGAFVDTARGLRIGADGGPVQLLAKAGAEAASIPIHGRAAAATAIALAGLALPLILADSLLANSRAAREVRPGRDEVRSLFAVGGAVAASIVLFQAAAARHVPAMLAAAPPAALLAFAMGRYRVSP